MGGGRRREKRSSTPDKAWQARLNADLLDFCIPVSLSGTVTRTGRGGWHRGGGGGGVRGTGGWVAKVQTRFCNGGTEEGRWRPCIFQKTNSLEQQGTLQYNLLASGEARGEGACVWVGVGCWVGG